MGIFHWSAGQLNETRFQEPLLTKSYWPGSSSSSANWAPWTLSLTAFYFNHITINGPNAACEGCFASCLVEPDGRVCVLPATICPNAAKVALKYTTRITLLTKVGAFSRSN
ncbi:hypothetical protein T06_8598 [Trichinella sp. T6]|nr:hypothetical protein T06_8598 [Trichinella sp. T6]